MRKRCKRLSLRVDHLAYLEDYAKKHYLFLSEAVDEVIAYFIRAKKRQISPYKTEKREARRRNETESKKG